MKVNKGMLQFETTNQTVESLMKQVLEAQKVNTSKGTVMLKLNKLFNRSGTRRRQANEASGTQIRGERDLVGKQISELQNKAAMRLILDDISVYQNIDTKKYLIIYFINNGSLYIYEDHLLKVDKEMFVNNYSETLQDQIINDNRLLNKMIDRYEATQYQSMNALWEAYYDVLKDCVNSPEKVAEIKDKFGNRPAFDDNISNIKKFMQPYIRDEKWKDYLAGLKDLRTGAKRFKSPNLVELCDHFDVPTSTYYLHVYNALNLLIKTHGFDLLANISHDKDLKDNIEGLDEVEDSNV